MLKAIAEPRSEVSQYAPKVIHMEIPVDKIRDVIGSGGKVIQKIIADTGKPIVNDISFSVRKGEILGIAGIAGSGQKELCETIAGL